MWVSDPFDTEIQRLKDFRVRGGAEKEEIWQQIVLLHNRDSTVPFTYVSNSQFFQVRVAFQNTMRTHRDLIFGVPFTVNVVDGSTFSDDNKISRIMGGALLTSLTSEQSFCVIAKASFVTSISSVTIATEVRTMK